MKHRINSNILTPEDLGNAYLGNTNTAIVPPKHRIDRAEYGRRLAELEGGIFKSSGYFVPIKRKRRKTNAE